MFTLADAQKGLVKYSESKKQQNGNGEWGARRNDIGN